MKCTFVFLLTIFTVVFSEELAPSETRILALENTPSLTKKTTTTTSAKPTTSAPTTAAPITSAPTTIAPTSAPTSPPTSPPSTTVKPTSDKWVLKDNGTICLMAMMKIKIEIPYNNTMQKAAMGRLEVPDNAVVTGSCSVENFTLPQVLKLSWLGPNSTSSVPDNWIQFTFVANAENKTLAMYRHFWLSKMEASINVSNAFAFPNKTGTFQMVKARNDSIRFDTPLGSSYSCGPATTIPVSVNPAMVENMSGQVVLASVQFEAFMKSTKTDFSSAIHCENGQTPDLVPILVGGFLIGLVIIVLVAYIITRRRSMARGYVSM